MNLLRLKAYADGHLVYEYQLYPGMVLMTARRYARSLCCGDMPRRREVVELDERDAYDG
jgi:hypothetical protein